MKHIQIIKGDITTACVDAIVNAANPKMLGGGGVDGAIHRAAGPELLEACRKVKSINGIRCPFGSARITGAGNLNAKYVIHAVGPIYAKASNPEDILESTYSNILKLAIEYQCASLAIPAISCGAYGFPVKDAAKIAVSACARYPDITIMFYLVESRVLNAWQKAKIHL